MKWLHLVLLCRCYHRLSFCSRQQPPTAPPLCAGFCWPCSALPSTAMPRYRNCVDQPHQLTAITISARVSSRAGQLCRGAHTALRGRVDQRKGLLTTDSTTSGMLGPFPNAVTIRVVSLQDEASTGAGEQKPLQTWNQESEQQTSFTSSHSPPHFARTNV